MVEQIGRRAGAAGRPRLGTARRAGDGTRSGARPRSRNGLAVEVLAEPQPWLAAGTDAVAEDAGRTRPPAAAVVRGGGHAARRQRRGLRRGLSRRDHARPAPWRRGAVVSTPGVLPAGVRPRCGSNRDGAPRGTGAAGVRAVRRVGVAGPAVPPAGLGGNADAWPRASPSLDAAAAAAAARRRSGRSACGG